MNRYFVTIRPEHGPSANTLTLAIEANDVFDAREKAVKAGHWHRGTAFEAVRVIPA